MTAHDLNIANQSFPATRADINNVIAALSNLQSNATAPTTTYAGMLWYDTANAVIKQRNVANSAWVTLWGIDKQGFVTQDFSTVYVADGGGNDAYVVNLTPALTAYTAGQMILMKANTANTSFATINVNGLGVKTIVKYSNQSLDDFDIQAGQIAVLLYDGTNFQLMNPLAPFGTQYRAGGLPIWQSASTVRIPAGYTASDDTARRVIKVGANVDVSLAVSGAGGLDTGSEASNTWYYLWLLEGGSGVTGVFSTSATAPTLPSGYNSFKHRIPCAFRNNGSSDIVPVRHVGAGRWEYQTLGYRGTTTGQPTEVLTGVNTGGAFTSASLASFVPPLSTVAHLGLVNNTSAFTFMTRPTGSSIAGINSLSLAQDYTASLDNVVTDASQSIDYYTDGGSWRVLVKGFSLE